MFKYILLSLVFSIGSTGQIMLKLGVKQSVSEIQKFNSFKKILKNILVFLRNYWIILAVFLYAIGFFVWLLVLTKFELSYAFPLLAVTYIVIMPLSRIFLKENISTLRFIGTIIIAIGIFLVAKS